MRLLFSFLPILLFTTLGLAQSVPSASSQVTAPKSGEGAAVMNPRGTVNLLEGIIEDFNYIPTGKRDPFKPYIEGESLSKVASRPSLEPMLPLERFKLEELRLVGIIWGGKVPKAMFLDPNDRTHIVRKNERVGRKKGYISVIREGEVVIVIPLGKPGSINYQTRILKLQKAESKE